MLKCTRDQIANDLNSAREVISCLLKDLERQGAIKLSGKRIQLIDEAILKKTLTL